MPGGEAPSKVASEAKKEAKAPGSTKGSSPPPEGKAMPSTPRTGKGSYGSEASGSAGPSEPKAQAGRRPGPTRLGAHYIPHNDTDRGGSWSKTKWKDSSRWTRESEWGARAARESQRADHHGWDAKKGKGKGMRCERDAGMDSDEWETIDQPPFEVPAEDEDQPPDAPRDNDADHGNADDEEEHRAAPGEPPVPPGAPSFG